MAKATPVLIAIGKRYFAALPVGRQRIFSSRKSPSLYAYLRALAYSFLRDCWRRRRTLQGPAMLKDNEYILIAQISASADSAAGDWVRNKPLTALLREQQSSGLATTMDVDAANDSSTTNSKPSPIAANVAQQSQVAAVTGTVSVNQ